jgi:CheY-like chemotaxis protein
MFEVRSEKLVYPASGAQAQQQREFRRRGEKSEFRSRASEAALPSLEGVRVLVVDDELDVRELSALFLRLHGARVGVAASTAEALALLASATADEHPHVILSDISMPDEDGFDFIGKLRASESNSLKQIPIIALTTLSSADDREKIRAAGFAAHLVKPPDADELVRQIAKLTERAINS